MALNETIRITVETVTNTATRGFNDLKSSVAGAEGVFAKLRAGVTSAGTTLKTLPFPVVAAGLAAAGAAAVKFGADAVKAFQDTALAAGELSDATGLSVEDASRWNEVAGDLGVSTETLTKSFGFLEKAIGKNPAKFKEMGITAEDASGQILQAIELLKRTPEGAERAAKGAQLFGRSWQEMSELIEQGADVVKTSLAEVSEEQVIDPKELETARRFRDSMNDLRDVFQKLSVSIGEDLAGSLGVAADAFLALEGAVPDWLKTVADLGTLDGAMKVFNESTDSSVEIISSQTAAQKALADEAAILTLSLNDTAEAQDAAGVAAAAHEEELKGLAETAGIILDAFLSLPDAIDAQAEAFGELAEGIGAFNKEPTAENLKKIEEQSKKLAKADTDLARAQAEANGQTFRAVDALDATNLSYLKQAQTLQGPAKKAILDRIAQLNGIPPTKITEIQALLDQGRIQEAEALLKSTSRARTAAITASANTAAAEKELNHVARNRTAEIEGRVHIVAPRGTTIRSAQGGVMGRGHMQHFAEGGVSIVGEKGAEPVFLPDGARVVPNQSARMWIQEAAREMLRPTVNFNVNGSHRSKRAEEEAVIRNVRAYYRRNGQIVSGKL